MSDQQDDRIIDTELGLVLRSDPFGGNEHEIIDIFNDGSWEFLEEDFGPPIDWPTTPIVVGKLVAQKIVMIDHEDNRGEAPTNIYCVEMLPNKERRAFYGNYQIDSALGCNPPDAEKKTPYIGFDVALKWEGKREQGKGGRTLNVYTIAVRKERQPVEEAF